PIYTDVFGKIGMVTLVIALVMALLIPWLNRMINSSAKEDAVA
ncbi:hypothetical protein ACNSPB_01510, partial [Yersinia enterocolitica]